MQNVVNIDKKKPLSKNLIQFQQNINIIKKHENPLRLRKKDDYLSNSQLIKKLKNKTKNEKNPQKNNSIKNKLKMKKTKSENLFKVIKKIDQKLDMITENEKKPKRSSKKKIFDKIPSHNIICDDNHKVRTYLNFKKVDKTIKNMKKKISGNPLFLNNLLEVVKKYAFHNKMFFNELSKI
jgi:hypothetical protein